jgi:hypothetical protein
MPTPSLITSSPSLAQALSAAAAQAAADRAIMGRARSFIENPSLPDYDPEARPGQTAAAIPYTP